MASHTGIIPGVEPPVGVKPNFVNPPSQRGLIIAIAVLAISFSTISVCLRIYTRYFVNRKLWWDDWTSILACIGLVTLAALMFNALRSGGGVDLWNVPKSSYKQFTKEFHDMEIVARVSMFFTKASIVLLYQRLFVPGQVQRTATWWAIWFVFWFNLLYTVALIITVTTECVNKQDKVAKGEDCLNQAAVVISATVINVVSDLMILAIPVFVIWGLQMPRERKVRLSAVFAVGALGVLANVARLGYLIPEAGRPNQTIIVMVLLMLNIVEQTIGIIVGCMPVLPAFYRHIAERYSTTSSQPSSSKLFVNSFFAKRDAQKPSPPSITNLDQPFTVKGYEEISDLEGQQGILMLSKT